MNNENSEDLNTASEVSYKNWLQARSRIFVIAVGVLGLSMLFISVATISNYSSLAEWVRVWVPSLLGCLALFGFSWKVTR